MPQPPQPHGCQPFSNERLLKLAAAMSRTAAVSSPPRSLSPWHGGGTGLAAGDRRTRGLGMGDGEEGFTIEQIRERVRSRYPEAEPLPDRPELDDPAGTVGLDVRWDAETTTYHDGPNRSWSRPARRCHYVGPRRPPPASGGDARHGRGRQFEERLRHAYNDGGFLVLTVTSQPDAGCEAELLRRFRLERVSFDELLFEALREEAENWKSIGRSSNRPTGTTDPARTGTTCCTSSGGSRPRSLPTSAAARSTCSWFIRA